MDLNVAHTVARTLMDDHGLADWNIAWDRAVKRYGQCNYGTRTLSFSRPLTAKRDPEGFRNTVLHEIAHALTPGANHGPRWRRQFIAIGGDGSRCSSGPTVEAPWTGVHDGCAKTFPRHRRPRGEAFCPRCYRRPTRGGLSTLDALVGGGPDNSKALIRWVRTSTLATVAESTS